MSSLAHEKQPRKCTTACTDDKNGILSQNMVFMSTSVVKGDGVGIVVATGDNTIWGQMMSNHAWPIDAMPEAEKMMHHHHRDNT
jgi:magnesium-transporting ATPase (P-type)